MFQRKRLLFTLPVIASLIFTELTWPGGLIRRAFGRARDDPGVTIVEEATAEGARVVLLSANCLDLTLTFSVEGENLQTAPALPATFDLRDRQRLEVATLQPRVKASPWKYRYTYRWSYGARGGEPDGTVYGLPFAPGARHKVIQGYRGNFSHQAGSPNEYAHDWDLAEGTTVIAARGGIVTGVRQDSTAHGVGKRFEQSGNYVIIRHPDQTYGEYLHLQPNGALVKLGETVQAGLPIGLSGNTGNTSRPHLHFAVFRITTLGVRETIPVRFRTADGATETLEEHRKY